MAYIADDILVAVDAVVEVAYCVLFSCHGGVVGIDYLVGCCNYGVGGCEAEELGALLVCITLVLVG